MSTNFESLVRPFQSEIATPSPYTTPGQKNVADIVLRLGRGGSGGKMLSGSVSVSVSSYCERHENEKSET